MNLKILIAALAIISLSSCGNKKENEAKKQSNTETALTPQQAAEKYCQCQNELLELSKENTPDLKVKMDECKKLQTAFDQKYMKDTKAQKTFLDAYFQCMPKDSAMLETESTK